MFLSSNCFTMYEQVYEYLDALPSYTELLKENRVGDVNCTLDEKTWKVMTPKALYRTGEIQ